MSNWRIRVIGILVLLALLFIGPFGPGEFLVWGVLLAVVLFAPVPQRLSRRPQPGAGDELTRR